MRRPLLCMQHQKAGPHVYNIKPCENRDQCDLRHRVFFGEKCLESFFNWLITDMHNGATVNCHNWSGYDHFLLLNEMMKKSETCAADVIFSGTRLLFMELKNPVHIRFINSYKFLSFPLATLPGAFELESDTEGGVSSQLCKGFFPHKFNTLENEGYVGPFRRRTLIRSPR